MGVRMFYDPIPADASEDQLAAYVRLLIDLANDTSDTRLWLVLMERARQAQRMLRQRRRIHRSPTPPR